MFSIISFLLLSKYKISLAYLKSTLFLTKTSAHFFLLIEISFSHHLFSNKEKSKFFKQSKSSNKLSSVISE